MARLTPLSKGIIALAVVGGVVSVVWNLALKDRFGGAVAVPAQSGASAPVPKAASPAVALSPGMDVAQNAEAGRKYLDSGNFAQARVHLELAAKGGDGPSACHLGDMTLKGQGGIQVDQDQAAKWFQLAQSRNVICFTPGK